MKNKIFALITSLLITAGLCAGLTAFMAPAKPANAALFEDIKEGGLTEIGYTAYGSEAPQKPLMLVIAEIIKYILSFLGITFLILILYGGFMWMTAGGNEDKVAQAKSIIINSAIGVVIILSAYAITYFVLENVIKATTGTGAHAPLF